MNEEEKKAADEAQKKLDAEKETALNTKIDELVKAVKEQSDDKSNDSVAKAAKEKQDADIKALAEVKKNTDIKKLMDTKSIGNDIDYDDLKPKEILDIVASAFETSIEAKTKLAMAEVANPMAELSSKLDGIQKYLINKEAETSVRDARAKFKDFDEFEDDINKLYELYPGIKLEHAYMIVKGEKSQHLPPRGEVDSERPISLGTRQAEAQKRHDDKEHKGGLGRRAFQEALNEAAQRVVSSRQN